jgi:hypothetical protein
MMISERMTSVENAGEALLRPVMIHPDTFGRMAVEAANVEAVNVVIDRVPEAHLQGFRDAAAEELGKVRADIASFEPDEARVINGYLNLVAPDLFRKWNKNPEITWTQWLSGDGIGREAAATDAQFTNVLQWHVDLIARQQGDQEFNEDVAHLKEQYKEDVLDAIEDGYLSYAAEHAMDVVDSKPVYIGDVFLTTMKDSYGVYMSDDGTMAVQQGIPTNGPGSEIDFLLNGLEESFYHEENHAALEVGMAGSPLDEVWISEALTEHVSASLRAGEFDIVDPDKRTEEGMFYIDERLLLSIILDHGRHRIHPSLATRAYSGTKSEQDVFLRALDRSWQTEDFLQKLNKKIRIIAKTLESDAEIDRAITNRLSKDMPYIEGMSSDAKAISYMAQKLRDSQRQPVAA